MRYWAASGRLGTDAAYDTGQMKVGRRLAIKVLNASKFALSFGDVDVDGDLRAASPTRLTCSMLAALRDVVDKATAGFEAWDYTRSLEVTETFFWTFCDDYLELVKDRAYGGQGEPRPPVPARRCASRSTSCCACSPRCSPTSPRRSGRGATRARCTAQPGPRSTRLPAGGDPALLTAVGEALAAVRKAKSEAKVGMRAEVPSMTLVGPDAALAHVRAAEGDLRAAGRLTGILELVTGDEIAARDVELVPVAKPTP